MYPPIDREANNINYSISKMAWSHQEYVKTLVGKRYDRGRTMRRPIPLLSFLIKKWNSKRNWQPLSAKWNKQTNNSRIVLIVVFILISILSRLLCSSGTLHDLFLDERRDVINCLQFWLEKEWKRKGEKSVSIWELCEEFTQKKHKEGVFDYDLF